MSRGTKTVLFVFSVVVLTMIAVYLGICVYFNNRFFPGSVINGMDVSGKSVEEAEELIAADVSDYTVSLKLRNGQSENIDGGLMDFSYVSDGAVQELKDTQNSFVWLSAYFHPSDYTMTAKTTYNEEMLKTALDSLECLKPENMEEPKPAEIKETSSGYEIEPEVQGTKLDTDKVYEAVKKAVDAGETAVDLDVEGCYEKPAVTHKNKKLRKRVRKLNQYFHMSVTYHVGDTEEVLDYSTIRDWMTLDDDLNAEFNWNKVADWMSDLSDKYDTFGNEMEFTTSLGETVSVKHETYGWKIDEAGEVEALLEILKTGESAERTPLYLESARTYGGGGNDIGDTYVEIDYTNQRMWFYKDGRLLVDTPIVTGNTSKKYGSPEGIFCIYNKEEKAVLKGEDYKTPVDFWMPFSDGVGIHDSKWRSTYGGSIYKTDGSHGCINTPWEQARIIFDNISVGDPVICYGGASNQGAGVSNIPQPAETRVINDKGEDVTDQQQSESEKEEEQPQEDDIPTVDL